MATTKKPVYTTEAVNVGCAGWEFVLRAPNGRVMMRSAKTYPTKFSAERAAESVGSAKFVPRPREKAA